MSTSVLGHYVRFDETAIDGLDPCDSGMLQRALGNLNHLADQYAQVRVKWVHPGPDGIAAEAPELGVFQRLWTSTPFDVHIRGDGSSYRMRVRLLGHSGHATHKATWRVVLSKPGEAEDELYSGDTNVAEITAAAASFTWMQAPSLVYLDPPRARRCMDRVTVRNAVGGPAANGIWRRVQASVWVAPIDDASFDPVLGGLEIEEYHE